MGRIANKCWRIVARVLGVLSMALAAGSCVSHGWRQYADEGMMVPAYGVLYAQLPVDSVGYQPPSPVHTGAVLTFTAQLPQGDINEVFVRTYNVGLRPPDTLLLDNGVLPDLVSGDRIYTGQLEWKAEYGTGEVTIRYLARGTLNGEDAEAQGDLPQLTVLP